MCTKTPHKHAELIKAWADGAIIQVLAGHLGWRNTLDNEPEWREDTQYRIKPEPKPDVVLFYSLDAAFPYTHGTLEKSPLDTIKAIFDGETGELKSVSIL